MRPLRILLLEDDAQDAELVSDILEADGFEVDVTRAQTRDEFVAALEDRGIDLILADYALPSFDGFAALGLALSARPDLPFIFVSGALGEEIAIEAVKMGAEDYVLKARLSRLVPSVHRALRETQARVERKKTEEALHRSELYLAAAERLSQTGSFGWNASSGELYWSEGSCRIYGYEPTTNATIELALERMHPEDRPRVRQQIERAAAGGVEFVTQHRLLMPDGSVKHIHAVARRLTGESAPDDLVFVGAISDITERVAAEAERDRLRQVEADLRYMNRVSMMGELAASLAHEIKQPIAAAMNDANACMRWLRREQPDVTEACDCASEVVASVTRAADMIDRIRSLYERGTPERELVDLNDIIHEMTVLLTDTASRQSIAIRAELDPWLPRAMVDRVQLRQVLMNLMLNGIEAMRETGGELTVASHTTDNDCLLISVSDLGVGLPDGASGRIFDAFFTTKSNGIGMGLSITRRIVESHGGRLWAGANEPTGTVFQFTLPAESVAL